MSQRNSGYRRVPDDEYELPPWLGRVIAAYLRGRCQFLWDPANGRHSKLAQSLRREGFSVLATNDDFLSQYSLPDPRIEGIVSNPPFGAGGRLACAFIEHALELAPTVAMLLRIDFDSAKTRTYLFEDCAAFARKIVLLDRVVWFEREGAAGPSENHSWFLWSRGHQGPPTISYARRPK